MNIFVLDKDPAKAAIMMCDRHIPKMIVESAQMLSTVHRLLDGTPERRPSKSGKTMQKYYSFGDERDDLFYLAVHKYHPCTTWTGKTDSNYKWHYYHFVAMAKEFEFRRGKKHATFEKLGGLLAKLPINIPRGGLTEFALAMTHYPDCMVPGDAVQSYRNYYHMAKSFAKWEWGREAPNWWKGYQGA
jgi:hypothetical protein|tara:strand:- start:1382 stop:1942 length:561 start_codon:yes stop_codon:yes gene_type:complete